MHINFRSKSFFKNRKTNSKLLGLSGNTFIYSLNGIDEGFVINDFNRIGIIILYCSWLDDEDNCQLKMGQYSKRLYDKIKTEGLSYVVLRRTKNFWIDHQMSKYNIGNGKISIALTPFKFIKNCDPMMKAYLFDYFDTGKLSENIGAQIKTLWNEK